MTKEQDNSDVQQFLQLCKHIEKRQFAKKTSPTNCDLTLCLMTCGEETEEECLKAVSPYSEQFIFQEVRNVTPAVTALNAMLTQCETKWLVPLDADMILNSDFIYRIREKIEKNKDNPKIHSILFSLFDTLTDEKIYALKIFNMDIIRNVLYHDEPCPDIDHYKNLSHLGFITDDCFNENPIGMHVVKGNFFCYAKYRDLYTVEKYFPKESLDSHFKGGSGIKKKAWNHYVFFKKKWEQTGNKDCLYCIAGMLDALKHSPPFKCKDLSNKEMKIVFNGIDIFNQFRDWYYDNGFVL